MFSSQGPGKACSVGPVQTTSRQQDWARTVEGEEEKIIRVERRTVGRNILPWNLLFLLIGRAKQSDSAIYGFDYVSLPTYLPDHPRQTLRRVFK